MARAINEIVRKLSYADGDVPSEKVGELVMSSLHTLDQVAYVRYASVYRNFREAKDFEAFVEKELGNSAVSVRAETDKRWMRAALHNPVVPKDGHTATRLLVV